jgi:hypothetical protein
MSPSISPPNETRRLAYALVACTLAVHVLVAIATPYEFHRDEFLYFSMGTHLRLFHMDFPPLIALLSEAVRHTTGVSVFTYRVVPGIIGTGLVALVLLAVRQFGGGRMAVLLAALAMLSSPLFMRTASLFQPVVLDQLAWMAALYALLRLEQTGDQRWWLALGGAGGLGLLAKFSIAFIGVGVLVALLATPHRRALLTRGPWLALLIALVIGSPSVIGQVTNDWPIFEQMAQLQRGQLDRVTWGEYAGTQMLFIGPAMILAITGLMALLRGPLARHRAIGIACAATFILLGALHGKPYYVGPIYPMLLAAGAVRIEQLTGRWRSVTAWGVGLASLVFGLLLLPVGLPIVPPEPMARYASAMGIQAATQTNRGTQLSLPQDYADMTGWREKAEAVAHVVESLPAEERAKVVIYGNNYGQAGALDLYGRRLGLPPVVSLAGSFYLFGPGARRGDVVVTLGVRADDLRDLRCASLTDAGRVKNPWGVSEERDVPLFVCRSPAITVQEIWRRNHPHWG